MLSLKSTRKVLERHILKKPFLLDHLDKLLNPVLGKSIAFYFDKNMKLGKTQENAYVACKKLDYK